jgi:hypothetical protein
MLAQSSKRQNIQQAIVGQCIAKTATYQAQVFSIDVLNSVFFLIAPNAGSILFPLTNVMVRVKRYILLFILVKNKVFLVCSYTFWTCLNVLDPCYIVALSAAEFVVIDRWLAQQI